MKTKKKRRPSYWTAKQLSDAGEIPLYTVRWWIQTKRIKSRRVGRSRLILKKEALAVIKRQKAKHE